ncbi:MAG: homoserine kinase [Thermomicrobiales bacterium]
MRFRVRAPASSANLGPGFDALGLALDLWNEIVVDTEAEGTIITGADAAQLQDKDNYTLFAMRELATLYGKKMPAFGMELQANVPVARGLGSSAAALVCGLLAANELIGLHLSLEQLFLEAWRMEGHGDNVGAAVYGGAVLAVPGLPRAVQLLTPDSGDLRPVVFIPEATSATWAARAALPANIPMPDAAHNVAAAAGLTIGLFTGNREAIAAGMHDRLHEPYRARLFPHLTPMTDAARTAGAIGACLSGAGPTILAVADPANVEAVKSAFCEVARDHRVSGRVEEIAITHQGAELLDESNS